jgi:hypothetical protein
MSRIARLRSETCDSPSTGEAEWPL